MHGAAFCRSCMARWRAAPHVPFQLPPPQKPCTLYISVDTAFSTCTDASLDGRAEATLAVCMGEVPWKHVVYVRVHLWLGSAAAGPVARAWVGESKRERCPAVAEGVLAVECEGTTNRDGAGGWTARLHQCVRCVV